MKKLFEFFRRIANRAQPSRKAPDELVPQTPQARDESSSVEDSTAEVVRTFEVRETSTGRFHLTGFGVKCGGADRNGSFVFVVRDRDGREVARSLPTTARQLSIAERGRRNYDANRLRQRDFFKRAADGRPVPDSAVARRCRWTFRNPSPQWEESYPGDLKARELALLASRKERDDKNGPSEREMKVGVALSGGGLRSATFAFGVVQALAKKNLLKEIDVLSTVSGGGYVGALISRLYSRDEVAGPDDVTRAILPPHEYPKPDREDQQPDDSAGTGKDNEIKPGSVWKWLKANGRYLAPAKGSGDVLLASTILIRNWLSVHVVLATFVLAVFLLMHLVRDVVDMVFTTDAPRYILAWFDCSGRAAADNLPLFTELDKLLNCNLPFGGNYLWWSPWVVVPLLFILFGVVALFFTSDIFSKRAYRRSRHLKYTLLGFGILLALAVIDTFGQTVYLFWVDPGTPVVPWFLAWLPGISVVAIGVRGLAARLSDEVVDAWMRPSLRLAAVVTAVLLLIVTFTVINATSHGIAWQFKYPSYVHAEFWKSPVQQSVQGLKKAWGNKICVEQSPQACPASNTLTMLTCTECVQLGKTGH